MWIAFKLVSLQLQTQRGIGLSCNTTVVNCFQISIFAVANTTFLGVYFLHELLWIAFKLVSLQLQTQHKEESDENLLVVNCFQISIFAVANTTPLTTSYYSIWLWIAFKLVSLQLQTQQLSPAMTSLHVVNCFQISIFAVANTTVARNQSYLRRLWIAFKLVSLQLQTQLTDIFDEIIESCELLSN